MKEILNHTDITETINFMEIKPKECLILVKKDNKLIGFVQRRLNNQGDSFHWVIATSSDSGYLELPHVYQYLHPLYISLIQQGYKFYIE